MTRRTLAATLALAGGLAAPAGAAGDTFFLLDNVKKALYASDTDNVPRDVLVAPLGVGSFLDLCPGDEPGTLFAVADQTIVTIDETTGALLGSVPVTPAMVSLAFDPLTETLYGHVGGVLYTIDAATGATQAVGPTPFGNAVSMAADPTEGVLYFAAGSTLYRVDPATAAGTPIGNMGLAALFGMAFNPADAGLYVTSAGSDSLYRVDRATAQLTLVGGPYTLATFATGLSFSSIGVKAGLAYCTGKPNSLGCTPAVASFGAPRASAEDGFFVLATDVRNRRAGVLLHSLDGRQAVPFQGGLLCVAPTVRRTTPVGSGGDPLPIQNCSGGWRIDMNAFAAGALGGSPAPDLRAPGTVVHCQWWVRAPDGVAGTSLSNALRYEVLP